MKQIGTKYIRQQVLRPIERRGDWQEGLVADDPELISKHHIISHRMDQAVNMFSFIQDSSDPALKGGVFILFSLHLLNVLSC